VSCQQGALPGSTMLLRGCLQQAKYDCQQLAAMCARQWGGVDDKWWRGYATWGSYTSAGMQIFTVRVRAYTAAMRTSMQENLFDAATYL